MQANEGSSAVRWTSRKQLSENVGSTRVHMTGSNGDSREFIVEAAIQKSFRLPAEGSGFHHERCECSGDGVGGGRDEPDSAEDVEAGAVSIRSFAGSR
jgi:hypothetical protein